MLGCCVTLAGLAACGGGSARGTLPRTSPSAAVFASSVGVLAEGSPLDSVAPASAGLDLSVLAAFVRAAAIPLILRRLVIHTCLFAAAREPDRSRDSTAVPSLETGRTIAESTAAK